MECLRIATTSTIPQKTPTPEQVDCRYLVQNENLCFPIQWWLRYQKLGYCCYCSDPPFVMCSFHAFNFKKVVDYCTQFHLPQKFTFVGGQTFVAKLNAQAPSAPLVVLRGESQLLKNYNSPILNFHKRRGLTVVVISNCNYPDQYLRNEDLSIHDTLIIYTNENTINQDVIEAICTYMHTLLKVVV